MTANVIYFAENETEEAVLVASDEKEALLLLGCVENCSCFRSAPCANCTTRDAWRFDKVGVADVDRPPDVLSRVPKSKKSQTSPSGPVRLSAAGRRRMNLRKWNDGSRS